MECPIQQVLGKPFGIYQELRLQCVFPFTSTKVGMQHPAAFTHTNTLVDYFRRVIWILSWPEIWKLLSSMFHVWSSWPLLMSSLSKYSSSDIDLIMLVDSGFLQTRSGCLVFTHQNQYFPGMVSLRRVFNLNFCCPSACVLELLSESVRQLFVLNKNI